MFAFLRKADHTTSRKTRKGRNRHNKRPGFEPLEGRVVLDAAGPTPGTAQNLGALIGTRTINDSIGRFDPFPMIDSLDFFRFTLTDRGSLNVRLAGVRPGANADLQVLNAAGNVIASSNNVGNAPDVVNLPSLPAGNYFARVNGVLLPPPLGSGTNYTLTLTADYAGNSISGARILGPVFGRAATLTDFVGTIDPNDFYRVTLLGGSGSLNARIDGLSADADLQIIRDANKNGVVDPGEVLASATLGGTAPDEATASGLAGGTYLVRVFQASGDTNYNLRVTTDYAGNNTATARDLGTLFGSIQGFFGDFVGASDPNDFYRINLTTSRTVTGTISGLAADADLQLQNAFGTVIASSTNGGTANDSISRLLGPGQYFFRVLRFSGDTNYSFTLTT